MGYRHIVISDTMVPAKDKLPDWFIAKYEDHISFKEKCIYWHSKSEGKRHSTFEHYPKDIQKAMTENDLWGMRRRIELIWFADEGGPNSLQRTIIMPDDIIEGDLEFEPHDY